MAFDAEKFLDALDPTYVETLISTLGAGRLMRSDSSKWTHHDRM